MTLPQGWVETTIGEAAIINPKHDPATDRNKLVSFVPMPSVDEHLGAIVENAERTLADIWTGYTHFADGDVIFAKITPCMENGKAAIARSLASGLACGSTEFYVMRPADGVSADYLWRFVRQRSFRTDAERRMTGAVGQRRVPREYLENHRFPLPPAPEQRRIVTKLDALTARLARARAELDRVPVLAGHLRRSSLDAAFRGGLTTAFQSGDDRQERRYQPTLDDQERGVWKTDSVPTSWQWVAFDEFFDDLTDSKRKLPEKEYHVSGAYPVIDQGRKQVGGYTDRQDLLHPANVPVVVFGDHTRCVKLVEPPFVQGADGVKVLAPVKRVQVEFARYALLAVEIPAKGYSRHMKFVRKTIWPLPPLREQAAIVDRLDLAFARADRLEAEAARARALIDRLESAILAKAFRGELLPQDPNDEPASALLDRIRAERAAAPKAKRGRRARETIDA